MRFAFVLAHRWLGLAIAAFLFVAGITGAVISWDHELDGLLNPHLVRARSPGPALPPLELAALAEQRDPRIRVAYVPMILEPGESLALSILPRIDPATGRLHELGFNQLFLDPATGAELGSREWGAPWPVTRENLVSFLYELHYSLHLPEIGGVDEWGVWLMGIVALVWTVDCFIGFYLTLPARRRAAIDARPRRDGWKGWKGWAARWAPAWKIKRGASAWRLNFDVHRAFGLWTWGLLFIVAFTGFSLNLHREIFFPLMQTVSTVTPTPFDGRMPGDGRHPIEPQIGYAEIVEIARREAARRGWPAPVAGIYYAPNWGIHTVQFSHTSRNRTEAGMHPTRLFLDATGAVLGERVPWTGTAADIFVQAQFPLHSGRLLGTTGRIAISLMGIVVAVLSVTGVVIWYRKRFARHRSARAATASGLET